MSRRPDERPFNWVTAGIILTAVVAILATGSWLVRNYPNSGYDAGYRAVIDNGHEWIRAQVDEIGATVETVCDQLHLRFEQTPLEPRYEHDTFVEGCRDAVGHLFGMAALTGSQ